MNEFNQWPENFHHSIVYVPLRPAARHLSFTRAADELFVTQAAISHQVKGLEDYLGHRLFKRLPRNLTLTAQGAYLDAGISWCI